MYKHEHAFVYKSFPLGTGLGNCSGRGPAVTHLAAAWISYYVCVLLFSEKVLKIKTFFPREAFDQSK